jgi:hypothetical protein
MVGYYSAKHACVLLMVCLVHANLLFLKEEEFGRTETTAKEALGKMSGEIAKTYFRNYHCIAVITEMPNSNPVEIFEHIPVNIVPTMHIHFSRDAEKTSELSALSGSTTKPQLCFEELLLSTLNQRCMGYIIQVSDLEFMVDTFNRLTRKSFQRINRQYVYLPTLTNISSSSLEKWDKSIRNIFPLRSLDFMPDLVVARYETQWKITQDTFKNELHTYKFQMTYLKGKFSSTHISSDSKLGASQFTTANNYRNNNVPENKTVKPEKLSLLKIAVNYNCNTDSSHVTLQDTGREYELVFSRRESNTTVRKSNSRLTTRFLTNNYSCTNKAAREVDGSDNFSFQLVTHKYTGTTDASETVLLDTWVSNTGFIQGANLFPDKLHNLMGKPFYITTVPYAPFVVLDIASEPPVHEGFEFRIIKEFVQKHQMKIVGVYDLDNWWGQIWDNGSGNGMSGLVAEDKADVAFAAVYLWVDEYRFIDYR